MVICGPDGAEICTGRHRMEIGLEVLWVIQKDKVSCEGLFGVPGQDDGFCISWKESC